MATVVEEVFAFDARVLRTLKPLLFKPGYVAQEYLAGKRARFVPPFRLYLLVSFVMFVAMALVPNRTLFRFTETPGDATTAVVSDPTVTDSSTTFGSAFSERLTALTEDPAAFDRAVLRRLNQAMFVLLPVFALLLKLTHRREPYVRHLIYAVYLHAFAFMMFTGCDDGRGE